MIWISWFAVILALLAYKRGGRVYDWANAVLWLPIAYPALRAGAYSSVAISVCYAVIAVWRLWRGN